MSETTLQQQMTSVYGAEVKHASQGESAFADMIREKSIQGRRHWFPRIGEQEARERIPGTEIVDGGSVEGGIWVDVKDYNVAKYIAVEDKEKLAYDQVKEYGMAHSKAIGRKKDQIVIDCFENDVHNSNKIPVDAEETIYDQILAAQALMGSRGVPSVDRCLILTHNTISELLQEERFTSQDFATMKSVNDGNIVKSPILGFQLIAINERKEGGLPASSIQGNAGKQTATRKLYAFHKDSLGRATTTAMKSSVDWIPEKESWLAKSRFSAGCGIVDLAGVVEISHSEKYLPYVQLINAN